MGYDFEMLEVGPERYMGKHPSEGVIVYGLYLEGCGWDAHRKELTESEPKVRGTY